MVWTRNQKRQLEENNIDIEVNDNYIRVNVIKKRKKNKDNAQENNNNTNKKDDNKIVKNPNDIITEITENTENESYTEIMVTETDTEIERYSEIASIKESSCETLSLSENEDNSYDNQELETTMIKRIINESFKKYFGSSEEKEDDGNSLQDENKDSVKKTQEKAPKTEYDKFMNYVDSIYNGNFFQRVPIEDKKKKLKTNLTVEQIEELNCKLKSLQEEYENKVPSIIDILKLNTSDVQKRALLEKIYHFSNSDVLSNDYNSNLKTLLNSIDQNHDPELQVLEEEILNKCNNMSYSDDYKQKVLKSNMSLDNKIIAYKRLQLMETYEGTDSSEYSKYKNWMDTLLSIPFGDFIEIPNIEKNPNDVCNYIKNVREILDKRLSFLEKPKDQIINIFSQIVRNPKVSINAIGLCGPKGVGKSSIVSSIAESLGRPYRSISLGGESDSSMLSGHSFTYVGSCPGRLIEILRDTKCMNPVILIDELDKVSETKNGQEIIGTLIHLTDYTTNSKYNHDKYFSGIEFDLSKVLFVFTYNDASKIDKILADRLFKINIENYKFKEKLEIVNTHLLKNVLTHYGFANEEIHFNEDTVRYIVELSKEQEGMRDIKRNFEIIVSRINTLLLTVESDNIVKLKYKNLYSQYNTLPVKVLKEHVDIFLQDIDNSEKIDKPPFGMYI